jgi:serine/threonine protein kinase
VLRAVDHTAIVGVRDAYSSAEAFAIVMQLCSGDELTLLPPRLRLETQLTSYVFQNLSEQRAHSASRAVWRRGRLATRAVWRMDAWAREHHAIMLATTRDGR